MRPRREIEKRSSDWVFGDAERLQIEVLLDIRDLLEHLIDVCRTEREQPLGNWGAR